MAAAVRMTRRGSAGLPLDRTTAPSLPRGTRTNASSLLMGSTGTAKKRKKVPEETEDEEMRLESEQRARRGSTNKTQTKGFYDEQTTDEEEEQREEEEQDVEVEDEEAEEEDRDEAGENGGEMEEEEGEDAEEEDVDEEIPEDDHFHIHKATLTHLRRLRRDELVRLYRIASGAEEEDAEALHKDDLITLLLETRGQTAISATESDGDVKEDSERDSPRPFTSQETSPALESDDDDGSSPRKKARSSGSQRGGRTRKDRRAITPPTSHSVVSVASSEDYKVEKAVAPKKTTRGRSSSDYKVSGGASSRPMTRRQSHDVVPIHASTSASPVVTPSSLPGRRMTRRHSHTIEADGLDKANNSSRHTRNGSKSSKGKNKAVTFDEDDETHYASSPIAHRTRGGSLAPPDTIRPNGVAGRAAKAKAVEKIVKRGERHSQRRPIRSEVVHDDWPQDERTGPNPDSDFEDDDEHEDVFGTGRLSRKIRPSQATPSDADEESGGDDAVDHAVFSETDEERETTEVTSYLRAPRQLRNGKVVPLKGGKRTRKRADDKEEETEDGDDDDDDDDEEEEEKEEEEEENEEEDEDEDEEMAHDEDVDLANATSKSLLRHRKDDLVRLCEERELQGDGTKKELVQALLEWRDADFDHSSGGSTVQSDATNTSTETARAETKSQALRRAVTVSVASNAETPLLMRQGHSRSPDKPHSRGRSRAAAALNDITEEINGLDLESLQLQDKEIAPEKLTKLEKVGSGGFKDVYKGLYRRKTIAICDIRGHLTEMDIKELGLLRDLRHPNIVHFIGVSIPKEPSTVPVMIVTELCANGDLFDYIRGVPHPPFSSMIDIMLGIARGVEYLHTRKPTIIHRDIKSSNVLITAQGVAKMADFGLARVKHTTRSVIRSLVGTVNWQAPELWVAHPKYNEKVDVYSVGLVFWEVLQWHQPVKRYPFEGMNEHAIYEQVGQKRIRPSTASMRRQWGGDILDLVGVMWDQDHSLRPSMKQVVLELEVLRLTAKEAKKAQKEHERSGRASR
ncbi:TKL protein kinase, variant [Microbotryum lychnidis-dioicae p1A1 Lamole]|uniref:TKL protein kinase n=1 Tax=Microbotryum lychnidis-dioicae (strain p1A1 Lamole / MvSl-1064) TaxID=683840 RepID=U5H354_USTV1|nr:TKL protein kinase [Microbotryum lychnidis-dioicae p1A1 Lamole]KDE08081.1 TKL protein kinase, variant [Microbotryum lychnidis-dioicae p1A1 Lamole]|eukprot:KDE08080.1 TKL protein kinase [Microbotryum lychnidis-dioicae p1A1 Lamole]